MKTYQALCYILTWVALLGGAKTISTSADCPPPYLNSSTSLTFDSPYGYLGYGTSAPQCCVYTLSVLVAYKLAPGDRIMIHGLEIENNMDVTTTSFQWVTIYMKGGETATAQLSGPGGAAPWLDS